MTTSSAAVSNNVDDYSNRSHSPCSKPWFFKPNAVVSFIDFFIFRFVLFAVNPVDLIIRENCSYIVFVLIYSVANK